MLFMGPTFEYDFREVYPGPLLELVLWPCTYFWFQSLEIMLRLLKDSYFIVSKLFLLHYWQKLRPFNLPLSFLVVLYSRKVILYILVHFHAPAAHATCTLLSSSHLHYKCHSLLSALHRYHNYTARCSKI